MKLEIFYFKSLKYAYWRLKAVVEVVDGREGDDRDEVALGSERVLVSYDRRTWLVSIAV